MAPTQCARWLSKRDGPDAMCDGPDVMCDAVAPTCDGPGPVCDNHMAPPTCVQPRRVFGPFVSDPVRVRAS